MTERQCREGEAHENPSRQQDQQARVVWRVRRLAPECVSDRFPKEAEGAGWLTFQILARESSPWLLAEAERRACPEAMAMRSVQMIIVIA